MSPAAFDAAVVAVKLEWCDVRAEIVALREAEADRKLGATVRGWTAADQRAFDRLVQKEA
jgi:hypothetical protein